MKTYKNSQIVLLLTPFVFAFAFGLDIYIPVVPQMTLIFETSSAFIHLTLSLFLALTGLGQLFIGPLSDQFGRKRIFLLSSIFFALGSLLCAISPHVLWLILSRVISAIGACGMLVTSFALVRDLYSEKESAKMYGFLNGAIGISPTFAPIIGGYLAFYFGWQSVFLFLAGIGLLAMLITMRYIEETHPETRRTPLDRSIWLRYLRIVQDRQFLIFTLISGLAEGVFFCFFSISPFIIIEVLGVAIEQFGYYFAIFGAVIGLGGFGSGFLIEKTGVHATIKIGLLLMIVGGLNMLGWYFLEGLHLASFLFPMVIACTGAIFLVGACASQALEKFSDIAGTAAAAFGALQFSLSSLIGALLMLFPVTSTIGYSYVIIFSGILAVVLYVIRPSQELSRPLA